MQLYYLRGACSLADHIVLEWIGAPYEAIEVARDALRSEAYLAISPLGAVPALRLEDGSVITQNAAILNFLADLHPQSRLGGDGTPRSRAEVNRWLALSNADIHPWFKPLFVPQRFVADESMHAELKQRARAQLRRLFETADAQLAGRDWLAGERSIADPYLFVMLRWARGVHLDSVGVDLTGLDHLDRFHARMMDDAGVQAALKAEGLA